MEVTYHLVAFINLANFMIALYRDLGIAASDKWQRNATTQKKACGLRSVEDESYGFM